MLKVLPFAIALFLSIFAVNPSIADILHVSGGFLDCRSGCTPTPPNTGNEIIGDNLGDTIYGSAVPDTIIGGLGANYLDGYLGGNAVFAATQANFCANVSNNTLIGGESVNTSNDVRAGNGADTFYAVAGVNFLDGEGGNNVYYHYESTANTSFIQQGLDGCTTIAGTNSAISPPARPARIWISASRRRPSALPFPAVAANPSRRAIS